jgi:preprotein translocase subunit SecG
MFHDILAVVHIFICVGLIGLVLIQHGRGADAGAAFGSGASATVFGSRGSASFLTRTTAILATLFFITSLTLAYYSRQPVAAKSVITQETPVKTSTESEIPTVETATTPTQPEGDELSTPQTSETSNGDTGDKEITINLGKSATETVNESGESEVPTVTNPAVNSEEKSAEK